MTSGPNPLEEAARAWHEAGASVLPAIHGKRPAVKWTAHQAERAEPSEWEWNKYDGLGIVTGYGGFELFELEGDAVRGRMTERLLEALTAAGAPDLLGKLMAYCEVTPSGGFHWIYKVEGDQEGSTKLARSAAGKTLIETRGKYAWTVMAPSGGSVHDEIPSGQWKIFHGEPGEVPTLTEEEQATLFDAARTLDELPPPEPMEHRPALHSGPGSSLAPGQDYNARNTWEQILQPLGWHKHPRGWTRPGKRYGLSATITSSDNLYIWSSSCHPLEEQQSYTKFRFYSLTEHSGNDSEAARELSRRGYGDKSEPVRLLLINGGASTPPAPGTSNPGGAASTEAATVPRPIEFSQTLTDDGNAQLLVANAKDKLLYSPERKQWLAWTGSRWDWRTSDSGPIQIMRQIVRGIDPRGDDAVAKHKHKSLGKKALADAVYLAQRDPEVEINQADLDADPYLLNTPNGVVNLLTGQLSPPSPKGLHTRSTGVPVDFDMPCPKWIKFLTSTFVGDTALVEFVQRLAGYSATGKVTHHVLPFLNGVGQNGKSQFMGVLLALLGTYAGPAPADFLLQGGRDDESAVAALSGMRLVVCSEVAPTARFNEQRVKDLTGGDPIRARFLYANHFTFNPTHHLWLQGNHQPRVDAGGVSFWRRLRLVPFTRIVPDEERIEGLAEKLVEEEGPGILAWIIQGARRQLEGLAEPEAVRAATGEYAEEEDHLGRFIADRLIVGGGEHVVINSTSVRHAYEQWCAGEGIKPIHGTPFGKEMKTHGIPSKASNGKRFYIGVTLRHSQSDEGPSQLGLD